MRWWGCQGGALSLCFFFFFLPGRKTPCIIPDQQDKGHAIDSMVRTGEVGVDKDDSSLETGVEGVDDLESELI